jgi:hypothetical protein
MAKQIRQREWDRLAEEWFSNHGYTFEYKRQYPCKTIFEIHKAGITDKLEISEAFLAQDFSIPMNLIGEMLEKKRQIKKEE